MRVHPIQTGRVHLKPALHELRAPERLQLARLALERARSISAPIFCWLIEHDDGLIVVDTGESASAADPTTFWNDRDYRRLSKHLGALRYELAREHELGAQLTRMGINPRRDVRKVVLTHLHSDHADGLRFFPNAEIAIARPEFARPHRAFPATWPIWFRPDLFAFDGPAIGAFAASHALTQDGALLAVPTPGHTFGHCSVIVRGAGPHGRDLFLAGDVTRDLDQLERGAISGLPADVKLARATVALVQAHLAQTGAVYLPAHDAHNTARLV